MKLFYKIIILALLGALVAPFFITKPNGQPMMSLKDLFGDAQKSVANINKPAQPLYRYQDDKGQWHYTDTPVDSQQAQKVTLQDNIIEMKTISLPKGFGEEKESEQQERFDPTQSAASPLSTAPLEKVPDMLKQIEGLQDKLDARASQVDNASR